MSDSDIAETNERLAEYRERIEQEKRALISELQRVLPSYLERKIDDVVRNNHDTIGHMSDDRLRELKKNIDQIIPTAVTNVTSGLNASDAWFKCKEGSFLSLREISDSNSPLWKIIQSIDQPFLPILKGAGLNTNKRAHPSGTSEMVPMDWSWFSETQGYPPTKTRLESVDREYSDTLREYCALLGRLRSLEEEKRKKAASTRWKGL